MEELLENREAAGKGEESRKVRIEEKGDGVEEWRKQGMEREGRDEIF